MFLQNLLLELTRILTRIITGRLLTAEQINGVTGTVVGKYFTDWFRSHRMRSKPRNVLTALSNTSQKPIESLAASNTTWIRRRNSWENSRWKLMKKRSIAERYAAMAATNETAVAAFRAELERALRRELTEQANRGKRLRQLASFTVWFVTLIMGAALGAYFPQIVHWVRSIGA